MIWTDQHDEILCREILSIEPHNCASCTVQIGEAWKLIAENFNLITEVKFSVNQRSVRERCKLICTKYSAKMKNEEKQSGIAPDEITDLEKALEDIVKRFEDAEKELEKEKEEVREKAEQEKQTAEEMRRRSMETFKDTNKRKQINDEASSSKKQTRGSGKETVAYLKERFQFDQEIRQKEMEMKEKEAEKKPAEQNNFLQLMMQQQQENRDT